MDTLEKIAKTVCGSLSREVIGPSRRSELVEMRAEFCFRAKCAGYSYPDIARFLHRDHTSVMYLVKRYCKSTGKVVSHSGDSGDERYKKRDTYKDRLTRGLYERAGFHCEVPGCNFDAVLEVHHIVPKRSGGSDDPSNLIVLCPNHHGLADAGMLYIKGRIEP